MVDDSDYIYAFERLIYPIVLTYKPEIILISAGFDGLKDDPIGKCNLSSTIFNYMLY